MIWNQLFNGNEFDELFKQMDRSFGLISNFNPLANVHTDEDGAKLHLEVPGIAPEDIEVNIQENEVHVTAKSKASELGEGERYLMHEFGNRSFERRFKLPFAVDAKKVKANCTNGVLTLEIPRAASAKPKKIKVLAA